MLNPLNFWIDVKSPKAPLPGIQPVKPKEQFDPEYMYKLFELGHRMAKAGFPWAKAPPRIEPPSIKCR
jgi:hypothetical protein